MNIAKTFASGSILSIPFALLYSLSIHRKLMVLSMQLVSSVNSSFELASPRIYLLTRFINIGHKMSPNGQQDCLQAALATSWLS